MGIGALIGAVFGAFISTTAFGTAIAGFLGIATSALWSVGASLGSLFDSVSMDTPSVTYTLDPISNPMAELIPVPIVYGKCRVAGNIMYQQFATTDQKIVYEHVALSEGPLVSGGLVAENVMANDQSTVDLDELVVEVKQGTSDQEPNANDPEGLAYPFTAYASLKMTASSKLQGNPTVTVVMQGRDIDFPVTGDAGQFIGAENSADGVVTETDTSYVKHGYKTTSATTDCLGTLSYRTQTGTTGENNTPVYTTYHSYYSTLEIEANDYVSADKDHVVAMPWTFYRADDSFFGATVDVRENYKIRVYPDSTNTSVYYDLPLIECPTDTNTSFTKEDDTTGFAVHWQLRKINRIDDEEDYGWYAGGLYIKIPADKVVYPGHSKIQVIWVEGSRSSPQYPTAAGDFYSGASGNAGLLNYTDILTDSPWGGFTAAAEYNNPAWCIYDLLTNTRYGCGIPADRIDLYSFIDAAAICKEQGMELNYVVDSYGKAADHLANILGACRGWIAIRGTVKLGIDARVSSYSKLITKDDIVKGTFTYWKPSLDDIPNQTVIEYIDGEDDGDGTWDTVQVSYEDWDDMQKRGTITKKLSINSITGKKQANAMLAYTSTGYKKCRWYCSFQVGLADSDIELGDVIAITYDFPGWTEKWMRVISVKDKGSSGAKSDNSIGLIELTCLEYSEDVYDAVDAVLAAS